MAIKVFAAPKRANVLPTTDMLPVRVDDVDCSTSVFQATPEDGQIVQTIGAAAGTAANPYSTAFSAADVTANNGAVGALNGAGLAMVWGGGMHLVTALKGARIPVLRGPVRVKTKLFAVNGDGGNPEVALKPSEGGWSAGCHVTVETSSDLVQGSAQRLYPYPLTAASGGWCIGFCTQIVKDTAVAGEAEVEIQLYDFPRLLTK